MSKKVKDIAIEMLIMVKKNLNSSNPQDNKKMVDELKRIIDREIENNDNQEN